MAGDGAGIHSEYLTIPCRWGGVGKEPGWGGAGAGDCPTTVQVVSIQPLLGGGVGQRDKGEGFTERPGWRFCATDTAPLPATVQRPRSRVHTRPRAGSGPWVGCVMLAPTPVYLMRGQTSVTRFLFVVVVQKHASKTNFEENMDDVSACR